MIKSIVCIGKNFEIGKKNGLVFNLKADMQHFVQETKNKIVVCGENTLLSFPGQKPLKGRSTIVLCPEGHEYENCICVHDFNQVVNMCKVLSITNDVFVIGGGMMYASMLPYCDELLVTEVDAEDKEATVFYPNFKASTEFILADKSEDLEEAGYKFNFCTYTRKK